MTQIHSIIKKAITDKKLVFFIGAGFSMPLGLPNWRTLLINVVDKLKRDYPNDKTLDLTLELVKDGNSELHSFDILYERYKTQVLRILKEEIDIDLSSKNLKNHKNIWSITDKIITTNYDKALEYANQDITVFTHKNSYEIANNSDEFLYKIHGCVGNVADCVLKTTDYYELYKNEANGAFHRLFSLLSDQTIIFLGFGLNDPYINELLTLRQIIYKYSKNHFIITTESDTKKYNAYGVEAILVNNFDTDIDSLLTEWKKFSQSDSVVTERVLKALKLRGKTVVNLGALKKSITYLLSQAIISINSSEEEIIKEIIKREEEIKYQDIAGALAHYNLGKLYSITLNFTNALKHFNLAVALEPENRDYVNELGELEYSMGKYTQCVITHKKALQISLKFGKKDKKNMMDIAMDYTNIGTGLDALGKYKNAIKHYEKSIKIVSEISEKKGNDPEIAMHYNNIGVSYERWGQYDKALEFSLKALKVHRFNFEFDFDTNPKTAIRFNNLGSVHRSRKEYSKAIAYYQDALKIDTFNFGENHSLVALRFTNLGITYQKMGQLQTAKEYCEKALNIFLSLDDFKEMNPWTATCYDSLGNIYFDLKDYRKSIEFYKIALLMFKQIYLSRHTKRRSTSESIKKAIEFIPK